MKPVPRDDNGSALIDRGSELFTTRLVDVGMGMTEISLPVDFKEIMLHVESGTDVVHVLGTTDDSETARLTSAGYSWTVPLSSPKESPALSIAAPTGTINVSVFAWR